MLLETLMLVGNFWGENPVGKGVWESGNGWAGVWRGGGEIPGGILGFRGDFGDLMRTWWESGRNFGVQGGFRGFREEFWGFSRDLGGFQEEFWGFWEDFGRFDEVLRDSGRNFGDSVRILGI